MTDEARRPIPGWLAPVAADLVCVLVFAIGGKSSHEVGQPGWVILAIVWPYALSVVLAHAGLLVGSRPARRTWPEGVVVLCVTYVLGMSLRVATGRGIATSFLVVAILFLALTMLGWRAALRFAMNRRAPSSP